MRYTISASNGPWDGYWHKVYIPLTNFSEQGSWDNGAWYNPEGKFDWKNIDRLEIVSEHSAGNGMMLWFYQIHLTRMDTCNVVDTSQYIPPQTYVTIPGTNNWALYPNPVVDFLYLKASQGSANGRVRLSFHDIAGRNVYSCSLNVEANATLKVPVKPMLQKGVYLLVVESNHNKSWYKVLVQ
jgi:endoglucanase